MSRRARTRAAAIAAKHVALVPLDDYTDQLAHRISDDADWLQWYCGDNDMGAKGLEVSSYSRTLRQLATVIVGNRTS